MREIPIIPLSLQEWRETDIETTSLRAPWDPLAPWFESQGFTLFNTAGMHAIAPKHIPRDPDGIGYASRKGSISWLYDHMKAIHCFARNTSGHDVLIRLIKKGDDGDEELDILQHVCTGHDAFLGENHCLPMLRLLTFANIGEILDLVIQLLEGLEYLHRHLIAHRDIGAENILINFIGGPRPQTSDEPFRCLFPIRYYYIDFELSVRFPLDSNPEDRVVTGIPILRRGYDHPDDYGRDLAPEIIGDKPHDPFKADVYQLGMMFLEYFKQLQDAVPGLIHIFDTMVQLDPWQRPTALQLLEDVKKCEATLTKEHLRLSAGEEPDLPGISDSERDRRYGAMLHRKAARKQAAALRNGSKEGVTTSHPNDPLLVEHEPPILSLGSATLTGEHEKTEPVGPVHIRRASGLAPAANPEAPPMKKNSLVPNKIGQKLIRSVACYFTRAEVTRFFLHLSLSFLFWCIILGTVHIPMSLLES